MGKNVNVANMALRDIAEYLKNEEKNAAIRKTPKEIWRVTPTMLNNKKQPKSKRP